MRNIVKAQLIVPVAKIVKPDEVLRAKIREEIRLENEKNIGDIKRLIR